MSPALTGAAIGAGLGIVQFLALRRVAKTLGSKPEQATAALAMTIVAWIDLVIFPVAGYVLGEILATPAIAPG